ncbi:MAG: 50S ribosomal protein L15 [Thermodesulfovibrionales bacterium]
MKIEDLRPATGKRKRPKRVGRGIGSGHGKTSCKGHKGQKARSGGAKGPGFEGGQMPLQRRLPKRGFKNLNRIEYSIVNLKDINSIEDSNVITPELLLEKGIVKDLKNGIKILGEGEIQKPFTVRANAFSASAKAKIEASGGKCELITKFQRPN